jgi:hypothetical protein
VIEAQDDLLPQRTQLAATLGLEQPVPLPVLEAALRDDAYAHNLLASRRTPAMLQILLANPPRPRTAGPRFSSAELVGRAAIAMARWARTGFSVVDEATLKRRRDACLSCPNLSEAPDRLLYRLTPGQICKLCGCKVQDKTRLPTEACPERDPERSELSRWGEAFRG